MNDYLEMWCRDLVAHKSGTVKRTVEAWGECKLYTGTAIWSAKVKVSLGPNDSFQIVDQLAANISERMRHSGWYEQIIFGVLDVMMTDLPSPYGEFTLTISDVCIHEIESRALAFRLAARAAVIKMLPQLWQPPD